MKLLEEKLVAKFEKNYGITADQQESSIAAAASARSDLKFSDTASELSYPDSSSSSFSTSFNSESEESVFHIDYSDSDSSSSPEIDLNGKAIKRKSSDLDDSLIPSAKRTEIPLEFLGDPKLTNGCFKIEPEENNNDPV
jgi:hypothetical protein